MPKEEMRIIIKFLNWVTIAFQMVILYATVASLFILAIGVLLIIGSLLLSKILGPSIVSAIVGNYMLFLLPIMATSLLFVSPLVSTIRLIIDTPMVFAAIVVLSGLYLLFGITKFLFKKLR